MLNPGREGRGEGTPTPKSRGCSSENLNLKTPKEDQAECGPSFIRHLKDPAWKEIVSITKEPKNKTKTFAFLLFRLVHPKR